MREVCRWAELMLSGRLLLFFVQTQDGAHNTALVIRQRVAGSRPVRKLRRGRIREYGVSTLSENGSALGAESQSDESLGRPRDSTQLS